MKKSLALMAVLGCFSQSGMAATTFTMANLGTTAAAAQTNFRALSEDFGSALSYKPVTPAAALGITGFDIGLEVSGTDMAKSATAWKAATGNDGLGTLPMAKLHIAKGLPFGIDVSAFYTSIPTTDITVTGAALSYAILEGGPIEPALTVRAAATRLNGVNEFSFSTKSLDISFSKGFMGFTPYIGAGQVWVDSSSTASVTIPAVGATPASTYSLQAEAFTQSKVFVGFNINFGLPNFAIEADQTGGTSTYSAKLGLRW